MDRWILIVGILVLAFVGVPYIAEHCSTADERREPVRIDQFDTNSKRTGYLIVDPKTGRVEAFDTKSRRTGSGQVQGPIPTPPSVTSPPPTRR